MKNKSSYRVIGLMSGTSLDGVDAAILETDGTRVLRFGKALSRPYSSGERAQLTAATQDALVWKFQGKRPASFNGAVEVLHHAHLRAVQDVCKASGQAVSDIDLIGFHGQTVLHRPPTPAQKGETLQLGDGARLARALGVDVAYDFRSLDVAAGGQGAPLAPIYHQALLEGAALGKAAVLNIGGVSNFTFMRGGGMTSSGALTASDCGPGNGPLDQWVSAKGLGDYDEGGKLSLSGTPDFARLEGWLGGAFFNQPLPKSADRYDFDVLPRMHGLSPADGAATLSAFCAVGVAHTLAMLGERVETLVVCGGGRKNPAIMAALSEACRARVIAAERLGWDGDALEAQAFGYLAVRTLKGLPISFPSTTAAPRPLTGGIIARGR